MDRNKFSLFAVFLVLFISSCGHATLNVDLRDCPYPVMCSPIMRIGDTVPPEKELVAFDEFSAKTEQVVSCSYWDHTATRYGPEYKTIIHRHSEHTFNSRSDDVAVAIQKATAGRSDLVVIVDEIKNVNFQHNSIFAFGIDRISVKGRIVLSNSVERER